MSDCKVVIFKQPPEDSSGVKEIIRQYDSWYRLNADTIYDVHTIFNIMRDERSQTKYKNVLIVHYHGEATMNPEDCPHEHLREEIIESGLCDEIGNIKKYCIDCKSLLEIIDLGGIDHNYPDDWTIRRNPTLTSVGIKFKKCIRCNHEITEEIPKLQANLEILSEYVNGMVIDTPYSYQLLSNKNDCIWSIDSGILPNGITLLPSGLLSGTPIESGLFIFSIKCEYNNQSVIKEYSVNIAQSFVTIIFDPNGGVTSETSRTIAKGNNIGELPTASMDGYVFGGWFTALTGGLKVDESYSVASNITLYARYIEESEEGGEDSDIVFGDATTQFNIHIDGDRTNYADQPYTFYHRYTDERESNLTIQTSISSDDSSNNMTSSNRNVTLYMKVTNNGEAGNFDIGFDCDSYVKGNDRVVVTRIENGVKLGGFEVTVPYDTTIWVGKYNERVSNRYKESGIGTATGSSIDSGYAFTINDIFINSNSYTILEVNFKLL